MSQPARVVFMGSPEFAVPSLLALASRPELCIVAGVVTQPDKPAGRGQRLTPPPVKQAAAELGLAVLQPTKLKSPDTLAALGALAPDLVVVAAYGRILPPPILALPRHGCVNVHASLLPRHRGASPIAHAIASGDAETGVSIMKMDEGLDTGPVYGTRAVAIAPNDTTATLGERLARLGADYLLELLAGILAGELAPAPQSAEGATYAPLLAKDDGWLDFRRSAVELERRVRAMTPWPMAFVTRQGQRIQVLAARVVEGSGAPGTVLAAGGAGVVVAAGDQALALDSVKPAGKGAMSGVAWAAGRGIGAGEALELSPPASREPR